MTSNSLVWKLRWNRWVVAIGEMTVVVPMAVVAALCFFWICVIEAITFDTGGDAK